MVYPITAITARYRIKTVKGQDDFASMAEVIRRRYSRILLEAREHVGEDAADATQENPLDVMRRIEKEESASADVKAGEKRRPFVRLPDLVIVDGGKGQLSKAVAELNRLGLHELPVIGLAKQHEEIFRPGESEPLLIPHDKGALKLLQRIRGRGAPFCQWLSPAFDEAQSAGKVYSMTALESVVPERSGSWRNLNPSRE